MRGVRPEEFLLSLGRSEGELSGRERRALRRLHEQDRVALAAAAVVVCVSEPFREHLGGGEKIRVIPNGSQEIEAPSPEERSTRRAALGLPPKGRVWVYSGSLARWQCAEETVRLFAAIERQRPGDHLVLLTHDPAEGRALVARESVAAATVLSLPPDEVRSVLPLFDAAFLLRARNTVNEVACPVKFAEYLHAGLPVVLTERIGDASRWTRDHELGVVLPSPDDTSNADRVLERLKSLSPERCRTFARSRLTFKATVASYLFAYEAALALGRGSG
jgi:glycosyltransferase involved in cell wall biosynthesis